MRTRRSARLLILNASHNLLLFRFVHTQDALAGHAYWATPGGGVEEGESFEQAALRELYEETGIRRNDPGPSRRERCFVMTLPSGERVQAHERFLSLMSRETRLIPWVGVKTKSRLLPAINGGRLVHLMPQPKRYIQAIS